MRKKGSRSGLGALHLGAFDAEGRLVYVGRAGTGFKDRELAEFHRHRVVHEVGQRAGDLDAGRAGADHDEVQRAAIDQPGAAVGVLEQADDA